MKTKICLANLFCVLALVFSKCAYAQSSNVVSIPVTFPRVEPGGGGKFGVFRPITNCYPYTRIGGEGQNDEFQDYITKIVHDRKVIPEILPAEQDTNGNWGLPTDGMQLSVRFRQTDFLSGQMVPAYIILRNLSNTKRQWWRNALPDNGYLFILTHGTNTINWVRPQSHPSNDRYFSGSATEADPYKYVAEPKTQSLTIVYLNRFYDLGQPGLYSLQVQIQVPTLDGKETTNVLSGTATFTIKNSTPH